MGFAALQGKHYRLLPPSLTPGFPVFLVDLGRTEKWWVNKAVLVLGRRKGWCGTRQKLILYRTQSVPHFFHFLILFLSPKPQMLSFFLLIHGQRPQSWSLPAHRLESLCIQADPKLPHLLLLLLRRLDSNRCVHINLPPIFYICPALLQKPSLILYVFLAFHPTSEQGNLHWSRTYSNEASSKPLADRCSSVCLK